MGLIARGGTWSPATHCHWPETFQAAARTLLLAASSAGAQPAVQPKGGEGAGRATRGRRRSQRAAAGAPADGGGGLAALPGSNVLHVLELAAMPMSDWL